MRASNALRLSRIHACRSGRPLMLPVSMIPTAFLSSLQLWTFPYSPCDQIARCLVKPMASPCFFYKRAKSINECLIRARMWQFRFIVAEVDNRDLICCCTSVFLVHRMLHKKACQSTPPFESTNVASSARISVTVLRVARFQNH